MTNTDSTHSGQGHHRDSSFLMTLKPAVDAMQCQLTYSMRRTSLCLLRRIGSSKMARKVIDAQEDCAAH
jgi:hypothetical protein